MVRKKIFFAFGLILFSFNLFSQDETDEKAKLKNEIAIDVAPVLGAMVRNTNIPGIVYRRHFNNSALRAKINFSFDRKSPTNYYSYTHNPFNYYSYSGESNESESINLNFALGFQRSNSISENWRFYYGVDLVSGLNKNKSEWRDVDLSTNNSEVIETIHTTEINIRSVSGGISPFLGFTWQLKERLSFSIESSFGLEYYHHKQNTYRTSSNNNSMVLLEENTKKMEFDNLRARLIPVNNFLISYHF